MGRFLAGAAATFLLLTGAFMIWQSRAQEPDVLQQAMPPAPEEVAEISTSPVRVLEPIPEAPEADPLTKEEKRFNRVDRNDDGKISLAELVQPRRKAYAKLDVDGDGKLSFEEWAIRTIDKFEKADADGNAILTRAEYATTKPKPRKKKPACACG